MVINIETVKKAMQGQGYVIFESGDYNLNIVGIRTNDNESNRFNDWLCLFYKVDGHENFHIFPFTTDPGVYWRKNPMNVKGTGIMAPGQYRGLWELGLHQGRYGAFVQVKPALIYRDNNGDGKLDFTNPHWDINGFNLHRANEEKRSTFVDKWSAGCQVVADPNDHDIAHALGEKSASIWGNSFTYTLLVEADFI